MSDEPDLLHFDFESTARVGHHFFNSRTTPLRFAVSETAPTRARSARVRCFRFFAFTSSPFGDKKLWYKGLSVKASPDLPSPVKAEKGQFLHPQIANCQAVRSEGEG